MLVVVIGWAWAAASPMPTSPPTEPGPQLDPPLHAPGLASSPPEVAPSKPHGDLPAGARPSSPTTTSAVATTAEHLASPTGTTSGAVARDHTPVLDPKMPSSATSSVATSTAAQFNFNVTHRTAVPCSHCLGGPAAYSPRTRESEKMRCYPIMSIPRPDTLATLICGSCGTHEAAATYDIILGPGRIPYCYPAVVKTRAWPSSCGCSAESVPCADICGPKDIGGKNVCVPRVTLPAANCETTKGATKIRLFCRVVQTLCALVAAAFVYWNWNYLIEEEAIQLANTRTGP